MKNRMPKRKTLGKESSFLRSIKSKTKKHSTNRQFLRHMGKDVVSSTKISIKAYQDSNLYVANKYNRRVNRKGVTIDKQLQEELKKAS